MRKVFRTSRFYKKGGKIEVSYFLPKRDSTQAGSQFGASYSVISRKHLRHAARSRRSDVLRTSREAGRAQPRT